MPVSEHALAASPYSVSVGIAMICPRRSASTASVTRWPVAGRTFDVFFWPPRIRLSPAVSDADAATLVKPCGLRYVTQARAGTCEDAWFRLAW